MVLRYHLVVFMFPGSLLPRWGFRPVRVCAARRFGYPLSIMVIMILATPFFKIVDFLSFVSKLGFKNWTMAISSSNVSVPPGWCGRSILKPGDPVPFSKRLYNGRPTGREA